MTYKDEIIGIFNGQNMDTEDGRTFPVNANYASKSKLVEGDKLKMTFADDGDFVFKQIDSVPRMRGIAEITEYCGKIGATLDNVFYKILPATIYYFKLEVTDEVVIVIPKEHLSEYAAVENVVKKQR